MRCVTTAGISERTNGEHGTRGAGCRVLCSYETEGRERVSYGDFFAELSGTAPQTPGWMQVAVWPFLVLVAVLARPRGR